MYLVAGTQWQEAEDLSPPPFSDFNKTLIFYDITTMVLEKLIHELRYTCIRLLDNLMIWGLNSDSFFWI